MISSWGNYPKIKGELLNASTENEIKKIIRSSDVMIPRGNGRSYGDSSLSSSMLSMLKLNRFIDFDPVKGTIDCEAGTLLSEILDVIVPRGWFLSVTPGTKLITVGGAIASDVHGKSHGIYGSFSDQMIDMDVLLSDGRTVNCSPKKEPLLFRATAGGMGLTGIILRSKFKLKKIETAFISQKTVKARNLKETMDLYEEYSSSSLTMSWIDCLSGGKNLGKSILMAGEHATDLEFKSSGQIGNPLAPAIPKKLSVPVDFPSFALNGLSVRAFNMLYYMKQFSRETKSIVSYDTFFYPLDSIYSWNRIYGKRGFTQYQFVLPLETSREGLQKILKEISKEGLGSFLAVLKKFGKGNKNLISFPMEGYTLALDFPITRNLFKFLDRLDWMVHDFGGRIYLSKDVRLSSAMFRRSYPGADDFIQYKHKIDKNNLFQSLQSKRIGI